MPRGTTLANLRLMLRAEIGQSMDTAAATASDSACNKLLVDTQLWLSAEYDWPFLEKMWDIAAAASSRYLNFPTTDIRGSTFSVNTERPIKADVLFGLRYLPVDYGVGVDEYTVRNSDLAQTMDPIQRWQFATNINESSNANQIEVWPMPTTAQTLRFTGQRILTAVSGDSSTFDLDDLLIVLTCAGNLLARFEQADAGFVQAKAAERMRKLLGAYPSYDQPVVLGRNLYKGPYLGNKARRRLVAVA